MRSTPQPTGLTIRRLAQPFAVTLLAVTLLAASLLAASLLATGPLAAPPAGAVAGGKAVPPGSYPFLLRLQIGADRACTGALVEASWAITAASCFQPADGKVLAGPPPQPTVATLWSGDPATTKVAAPARIVDLVPRPDRNVVLARLDTRFEGVPPIAIATRPPASGEVLRVAGYGRTTSQWVPNVPHSALVSVASVGPATLAIQGSGQPRPAICRGDAGGPAFRDGPDGAVELVAVHSASWQHGCLGETETRNGAIEARADNLASWVRETVSSCSRADDGYLPLYDGRSADGSQWRVAGSATVADGACETMTIGASAVRWYAARRLPAAYTLRVDWQAVTDQAQSGVYLGFGHPGDDPAVPGEQGIEVLINQPGSGVAGTGAVAGRRAPRPEAASLVRPVGSWNTFEFAVTDQRIDVRLNQHLVNSYRINQPSKLLGASFIGLSGSPPGGLVRFRAIGYRPEPPADRLLAGQSLTRAENFALTSSDGRFTLILRPQGDAVLSERHAGTLWTTGTTNGVRLTNEPEGRLALYTADDREVWSSGPPEALAATLIVHSDGNLALHQDADGKVLWSTGTRRENVVPPHLTRVSDTLPSGQALLRDDSSLYSPDGRIRVTFQASDGKLAMYWGGARSWELVLGNAAWLSNQPDGNLVSYTSSGQPIWHTETHGAGPARLTVRDDGQLVLVSERDGKVLWSAPD